MKRLFWATAFLGAASLGCGGGATQHPTSRVGSFSMIEGAVDDINATIMSPTYKSNKSRDLGTDSDRIGMALLALSKETEGTSLSSEIGEIRKKFDDLEKLVASRAPVEKQREAAKALKDTVAAIKAKL